MILIFSSIYTLHQALPYDKIFKEILASLIHYLESTDVVARALMPHLSFFFFPQINSDFARFVPTQLDSCRIGFDSQRTGLIWPESGCIGHIGSYRPATDAAETGRNKP